MTVNCLDPGEVRQKVEVVNTCALSLLYNVIHVTVLVGASA